MARPRHEGERLIPEPAVEEEEPDEQRDVQGGDDRFIARKGIRHVDDLHDDHGSDAEGQVDLPPSSQHLEPPSCPRADSVA